MMVDDDTTLGHFVNGGWGELLPFPYPLKVQAFFSFLFLFFLSIVGTLYYDHLTCNTMHYVCMTFSNDY